MSSVAVVTTDGLGLVSGSGELGCDVAVVGAGPYGCDLQAKLANRAIRPAGARWLVDRLTDVPFLAPHLTAKLKHTGGYPNLSPGMESSMPGLHFLGAPAARSHGPTMRFVSGSWHASTQLTNHLTKQARAR